MDNQSRSRLFEQKLMNKKIFQKGLLKWYFENRRNYPWRETENSYYILISEILLQKTDSRKIEKLYPKFIAMFPTIECICQSNIDDIEAMMKDIGLFYKSKRIKKIAKDIMFNFRGSVPDSKEDLLSLYGVGEYISNAILCFAFKKKVPIVDANVIRIYQRIFNHISVKSRPHMDKDLWRFAEFVLPDKSYVEYNYALLDFGALICKSRNPLCNLCPVNDICDYNNQLKSEMM